MDRPDQDIVEAFSQHAREVLVVDGVEELGLIQVAAEGVSHTGVSQGAEGTVELQRVVVKLPEVFQLGEFQDVQTPDKEAIGTSNTCILQEFHFGSSPSFILFLYV